eukprot:m.46020 g.46020  ORF g.46020 m.46020 type:complete len:254 (-) comp11069_c0_seq1:20-781(-)
MELRAVTHWVDECDWYLMVFMWDTVLGCGLNIVFYRASAAFFANLYFLEPLSRIGDYEAAPNLIGVRAPSSFAQRAGRWLAQVLHWVICAVLGRLCVFVILYSLHNPFGHVATWFGAWACTESQVELKTWLFIVLVPVSLDAIQFVVQSFWLKPKAEEIPRLHLDNDDDDEEDESGPGDNSFLASGPLVPQRVAIVKRPGREEAWSPLIINGAPSPGNSSMSSSSVAGLTGFRSASGDMDGSPSAENNPLMKR